MAIQISHSAIIDEVYPGEDVKYVLNITNDGVVKDTFHVLSWSTWTATISKTLFNLEPNETRIINVTLTVPIDVSVQHNEITIDVSNDRQDEQKNVKLIAKAITLYPQGFSLADYDFPSGVDPREQQELTVTVTSELDKRLPGAIRLTVKDSNNEVLLTQEDRFSYDPMKSNVLKMVVNFSEKQTPGKYFMEVEAYVTSRLIGRKSGSFSILPYSSITQSMTETKSLLGQAKVYEIINDGTGTYQEYTIKEKVGPLTALLISNSFGAEYADGEFTWTVEVNAGETVLAGYTITFIPLILLPFILVLIAYLYWRATRKIILKKEVVRYYSKDNHTIVKVIIKVKNASRKTIKNVKILEQLSPFVSKISDFHTLKPKLVKSKESKRLEWVLDRIKAKGEVVLSYAVHTKVGIVGQMFFEPSTAVFKFKNKKCEEKSNVAGFEARTE